MTRPVRVRSAYIRALTEALPARFVDFLAEAHPRIISEAAVAFSSPAAEAPVDPDHDYAVIRGAWESGGCDYEAIAQLTATGTVELLIIEIDLDPLYVDDIIAEP